MPLAHAGICYHRPMTGTQLKALRARLDLSQVAFAARYHIDVQTVSRWEQGVRHPSGPALALLALINHEPELVAAILAKPAP